MENLLHDPNMRVLGQENYDILIVFGKNMQYLTSWMQKMAWVEFPMYRDELYELHKVFHSHDTQQELPRTLYVFVTSICKIEPKLKPLYALLNTEKTL